MTHLRPLVDELRTRVEVLGVATQVLDALATTATYETLGSVPRVRAKVVAIHALRGVVEATGALAEVLKEG